MLVSCEREVVSCEVSVQDNENIRSALTSFCSKVQYDYLCIILFYHKTEILQRSGPSLFSFNHRIHHTIEAQKC